MKREASTKRHARDGRRPALVPVPEKVAALLKLVNLLPGCIRNPYWAALDRDFEQLQPLKSYVWQILDWRPNTQSLDGFLADQLEKDIPEWLRHNTPHQLWFKLSFTIRDLPLLLQAFVINDDQWKVVEMVDQQGARTRAPMYVAADFQIESNFAFSCPLDVMLIDPEVHPPNASAFVK